MTQTERIGWSPELTEATVGHERANRCARLEGLIDRLAEVADDAKIYSFKHRFKKIQNIEAKVLRKREEGHVRLAAFKLRIKSENTPVNKSDERYLSLSVNDRKEFDDIQESISYETKHVSDILGCRYITLYQSEIPRTVDALLNKIADFNNNISGVNTVKMTECVIYSNRLPTDPLSIADETYAVIQRKNRSIVINRDTNIRPAESKKSSYSSVHFVFERAIPLTDNNRKLGDPTAIVTFEVQVRDIFEEGWGEIQHHLLYSTKDSQKTSTIGQELWAPHLNALKTFVDGCSQFASIIWKNKEQIEPTIQLNLLDRSITSREEDYKLVLRAAFNAGATKHEEDLMTKSYMQLNASSSENDPVRKILKYGDTRVSLQKCLNSVAARPLGAKIPGLDNRTVGYFFQMELAHSCYACASGMQNLTAKEKESVDEREFEPQQLLAEAIEHYQHIEKTNTSDAAVKYRLARCKGAIAKSSQDFEAARNHAKDAINSAPKDGLTGASHWIVSSAWGNIGYNFWREASLLINTGNDESLKKLDEAIVASENALKAAVKYGETSSAAESFEYEHKTLANICFYLTELARLDVGNLQKYQTRLSAHMKRFTELGPGSYVDYFRTKDNLARAHGCLGNVNERLKLASEIVTDIRTEAERRAGRVLVSDTQLTQFLRPGERTAYYHAVDLLSDSPNAPERSE